MMQQWNQIVTKGAVLNVRLNIPSQSQQQQPEQSSSALSPQQDSHQEEVSISLGEVPSTNISSSIIENDAELPSRVSLSFPFSSASSQADYHHHHLSSESESGVNDTHALDLTIQVFRNAETLPALWRIWFDGLPGRHPVCDLDKVYGVKKWRGSSKESKFYQRRQKVIKKIEAFITNNNYSKDEALRILEEKRVKNSTGELSVHRISEQLDTFFPLS